MSGIAEFIKFRVLPSQLYLSISARTKKRRVLNKGRGETELELLPIIVPRNKVAIDIGANKGLYTYFLSRVAKQVLSYEPIPVLANFLKQAVSSNVVVREKAVSDRTGNMEICVPKENGKLFYNLGSLEAQQTDRPNFRQDVELTTLDAENLVDVGFIKIDIEGHELSAVKGATKTINRDKPVILIEVLDRSNWDASALGLLEEMGYEIFVYEDRTLKHHSFSEMDKAGRNFVCFPKQSS